MDKAVTFPLRLIGDEKAVARAVLDKHTGAVLLLTAAIEWFTQAHYLTAFLKHFRDPQMGHLEWDPRERAAWSAMKDELRASMLESGTAARGVVCEPSAPESPGSARSRSLP